MHCWLLCVLQAVLKSAEAIIWERGNNKSVKLQGADRLALQYAFHA